MSAGNRFFNDLEDVPAVSGCAWRLARDSASAWKFARWLSPMKMRKIVEEEDQHSSTAR